VEVEAGEEETIRERQGGGIGVCPAEDEQVRDLGLACEFDGIGYADDGGGWRCGRSCDRRGGEGMAGEDEDAVIRLKPAGHFLVGTSADEQPLAGAGGAKPGGFIRHVPRETAAAEADGVVGIEGGDEGDGHGFT
jgi:hypothetical protein